LSADATQLNNSVYKSGTTAGLESVANNAERGTSRESKPSKSQLQKFTLVDAKAGIRVENYILGFPQVFGPKTKRPGFRPAVRIFSDGCPGQARA
jgi:hypothetical protein